MKLPPRSVRLGALLIGVTAALAFGWVFLSKPGPDAIAERVAESLRKRDWKSLYQISVEGSRHGRGWSEESFVRFWDAIGRSRTASPIKIVVAEPDRMKQATRRYYNLHATGPSGVRTIRVDVLSTADGWRASAFVSAMDYMRSSDLKLKPLSAGECAKGLAEAGIDWVKLPSDNYVVTRRSLERVGKGKIVDAFEEFVN